MTVVFALLIPFLGTVSGAACALFIKKPIKSQTQKSLTGFAAGVMIAASFWSLLIPSIEQSKNNSEIFFLPPVAGFWFGILFLLLLDIIIPHLHQNTLQKEGAKNKLKKTTMMILAVTLHNIPEGMAVGIVYADLLSAHSQITPASAAALSVGIALQNFPEGAIVSIPLRVEKMNKNRAFLCGVLSGLAEPIGTILTILSARFFISFLPYLLSFAAGSMIYVVVEELIPEMSFGKHTNTSTVFFAFGFSIMMLLEILIE